MWRYGEDIVRSTTREEILQGVNRLVKSPWYGHATDFTKLLGGVESDTRGRVVSAKTAMMIWSVTVPDDVEVDTSQGSGVELEFADTTTLAWEAALIDTTLKMEAENITILLNTARSYGDISNEAIGSDMYLLSGGFVLMFVATRLLVAAVGAGASALNKHPMQLIWLP